MKGDPPTHDGVNWGYSGYPIPQYGYLAPWRRWPFPHGYRSFPFKRPEVRGTRRHGE